MHHRTTLAARLAWHAYTARRWAVIADAALIAALLGGLALWLA